MIKELSIFLHQNYGVDLTIYEESFLNKIINKRISSLGMLFSNEYLANVQKNKNEVQELFDSLHINFSEFFRNRLTFAILESTIIPELFERKQNNQELRIWSAACASGQEAYSVAIIIDEFIQSYNNNKKYRIFASDLQEKEINRAKNGIFTQKEIESVTLKRLNEYFTNKEQKYTIKPLLKENIEFSKFDIVSDPNICPPSSIYGNFDVILCCNVLFYYSNKSRRIIIDKLTKCLDKKGYIIVGNTEREIVKELGFSEVIQNSCIFIK